MAKYIQYLTIVILGSLSTLWFGATLSFAYVWEMSPLEQAAWTDFTSRNRIALKKSLINLAQHEPASFEIHPLGGALYLYDREFSARIVKILTNYLKKDPDNVQVNITVGRILLDNSIPITGEIRIAQLRHWYSIPPEQSLSTTLHREDALTGIAHLEHALTYITGTTETDIIEANFVILDLVQGYLDLGEYDKGILTVNLALIRFPIYDRVELLNCQAECYLEKKDYHQAYWLLREALSYKDDKPEGGSLYIQYTYNALGKICLKLEKVGEARYWMQQLANRPYISKSAPTSLATGLMDKGYYEEVRKYYDTLNRSPAQKGSPTIQWLYTKLHQHYDINGQCPIAGNNPIVNWFYNRLRKFWPQ